MTTLLDKFSKISVGIEFREDSLIVSCLKNSLSGMHILSSSAFPLKDDEETVSEIKNFISQYKRDFNNIFVCLPHKWAIIKFIDVPSTKGKGKNVLSQMLHFEIERHIPFQIDDVLYDFQLVKKTETTYTVMFVAVHKGKIDYINGLLEKIHLRPDVFTLSPFAVLNSVELSESTVGGWQELLGFTKKTGILGRKGESCISLYADKTDAYFTLLKDGLPLSFKTSHFDLERPIETIVEDISQEASSLFPELPDGKVSKLLLSGTITALPDLPGELSSKLGINVNTANPAARLIKKGKHDDIHDLIPSSGACYSGSGLGSLKINLLPHKADFALGKTATMISKISVPLIFFLIVGIFIGELIYEKRLLAKIDQKLRENKPEIKTIEKISGDLNIVESQRDILKNARQHDIALDILAELSKIIPTDAWLTNFKFKEIFDKEKKRLKGEILISGFAISSSELISILEDSMFFEKVEFVGPVTKKRGKEGFKIKADTVLRIVPPETQNPDNDKSAESDIGSKNK